MPEAPSAPFDALIRRLGGAKRLTGADERAIRGLPIAIRTFKPNQVMVHEGDPSPNCCIVLDGWTCCYQILAEGRRQIFSLHVPGEMPDLQSLHLPEPDFGMGALTAARVAFVPHTAVRALMAASPCVAAALYREALITAAIHRAWMTGLGRRDGSGRLAHLLLELHARLSAVGLADGASCPLPLTQADLADVLGQTSVHINRTLRDMRGLGLITLVGRRLTIHNRDSLIRLAEFDPRYLHLEFATGGDLRDAC